VTRTRPKPGELDAVECDDKAGMPSRGRLRLGGVRLPVTAAAVRTILQMLHDFLMGYEIQLVRSVLSKQLYRLGT
jgi:hypothetical protein